MSLTSVFTSNESAKRWRDHMTYNYINNDHSLRPCVFQVPESLRETKAEAYTPQGVGLGPYHHFRPEVQHRGSEKLAAVKDYLSKADIKIEKEKSILESFRGFLEKSPEDFEPIIRSCYDRFLDLDNETLAWVVIVDGLFLVDFIYAYLEDNDKKKKLEDNDKKKKQENRSDRESLVPDILMLENQIPIKLIGQIRGGKFLQKTFNIATDIELRDKFYNFCEKQSPLEFTSDQDSTEEAFDPNNHMLHYMYQLIVKNKPEENDSESETGDEGVDQEDGDRRERDNGDDYQRENDGDKSLFDKIRRHAEMTAALGSQTVGLAIEEFGAAVADAQASGLKVPGNVEKATQILRNLQKALHHGHRGSSSTLGDPSDIPSASRLKAILRTKFKALHDGGIQNIDFKDNNTLWLPVITFKANSEVILRNLVAYEAASKMGSTELRDYMDLMCGLIKSPKDVTVLKDAKIISTGSKTSDEGRFSRKGKQPDEGLTNGERRLLDDEEIVRLFNEIGKSDEKIAEKSNPRKAAQDVKMQFNDARCVKACRKTMKCFAGTLNRLKPLFPALVLLFLFIQSYCQLIGCRRSLQAGPTSQNLYLGNLDAEAIDMLPRKLLRN